MNGLLKAIILGVTISSLFGAVILSLTQNGVQKEIVKFAVGLIIANTLFIPIAKLNIFNLDYIPAFSESKIEREIEDSKNLSKELIKNAAKDQVEIYLTNLLEDRGYTLNIDVDLITNNTYETTIKLITISGISSNYDKENISEFLISQCQITRENIIYV